MVNDRIYLNVPFSEKDTAKSAGARFDGEARRWYWPGCDLPSQLKQYAPADGALSERQIEQAIAERVAATALAIPAALDEMRKEISRKVADRPPADPTDDPYASMESLLAQQDEDIITDAIEILSRNAKCDRSALQDLLEGNMSRAAAGLQVSAALRATLGGTIDARARLEDVKRLSAKALIATAWRQRVRAAVEQQRRAVDGLLRAQREAILDAIAAEINPHAAVRAWHDDKPYTVRTVTGVHILEIGMINDLPVVWSVDGQEVEREWRIDLSNGSVMAIARALREALADQAMPLYPPSMTKPAR